MSQQQQDREQTVVGRFYGLSPDRFSQEIDRVWGGVENIKECIAQQVNDGAITPLDGLAMVAGVTATAFGYHQTHGQPTPSDLLTVLRPASTS